MEEGAPILVAGMLHWLAPSFRLDVFIRYSRRDRSERIAKLSPRER